MFCPVSVLFTSPLFCSGRVYSGLVYCDLFFYFLFYSAVLYSFYSSYFFYIQKGSGSGCYSRGFPVNGWNQIWGLESNMRIYIQLPGAPYFKLATVFKSVSFNRWQGISHLHFLQVPCWLIYPFNLSFAFCSFWKWQFFYNYILMFLILFSRVFIIIIFLVLGSQLDSTPDSAHSEIAPGRRREPFGMPGINLGLLHAR